MSFSMQCSSHDVEFLCHTISCNYLCLAVVPALNLAMSSAKNKISGMPYAFII